jgi:hypothetical protein
MLLTNTSQQRWLDDVAEVHQPGIIRPAYAAEHERQHCMVSADGLGGAVREHVDVQLVILFGREGFLCCALL